MPTLFFGSYSMWWSTHTELFAYWMSTLVLFFLVNALIKFYCMVLLPYNCIGYVYLHRCMRHINISLKSSFCPAKAFPRHYRHIRGSKLRASHLRFHELTGYTGFCRYVFFLLFGQNIIL